MFAGAQFPQSIVIFELFHADDALLCLKLIYLLVTNFKRHYWYQIFILSHQKPMLMILCGTCHWLAAVLFILCSAPYYLKVLMWLVHILNPPIISNKQSAAVVSTSFNPNYDTDHH